MGGVRRDDGPVHVTVRSTDGKQVRKMLLEEKAQSGQTEEATRVREAGQVPRDFCSMMGTEAREQWVGKVQTAHVQEAGK